MSKFQKFLLVLVGIIVGIPFSVWAVNTQVPWTRINGSGQIPFVSTDQILVGESASTSLSKLEVVGGALIDTATTTSATSTSFFATTASTTNLFLSTGTGCLQVTSGKVGSTGSNCTTGTVTSVATNNGVTGGTITTSGTLSLDQTFGAVWTAASSTYVNGLTIGTATTTSATSTSFFSTTASTSNLYLATGGCSGSSALNVVSGKVTCGSVTSGGTVFVATTTVQNLATTTLDLVGLGLTNQRRVNITFETGTPVGSGATSSAIILAAFANDLSANYTYSFTKAATGSNTSNAQFINIAPTADQRITHDYISLNIDNPPAPLVRMGDWTAFQSATSSSSFTPGMLFGNFLYNNTSQITRVDFWWSQPNVLFATSTVIYVTAY